jgi:formate dehydrogenase subunit beta
MENLQNLMREILKNLVKEHKVDIVIGYEKGTLPLRTTPCFVTKEEEIPRLVWNACCDFDLIKYLFKPENQNKKIGLIVKGCDARALTVCIAEKQIERNKIFIIGMPCLGIIDKKKIEAAVAPKEILEAKVTDDQIIIKGKDFEQTLSKKDYLQTSCLACHHNNPPIYDVLVGGEPLKLVSEEDWDQKIAEFEAKSPEERWAFFSDLLKGCIKCYACRNACPLCYCKECFVDQTQPQWVGKTTDISDIIFYHIMRAFHVAGRCIGCGACTRACPMNIDLRLLSKKLEKIVKDRYNFEAGLNPEEAPPMGAQKADDPQEFITEGH